MPNEEINPIEVPPPPIPKPVLEGQGAVITPQGYLEQPEMEFPPEAVFGGLPQQPEGSYHSLSPEAMRLLWSPQVEITPQQPM